MHIFLGLECIDNVNWKFSVHDYRKICPVVHMHILLGLGCIGNVNWKLLNKDDIIKMRNFSRINTNWPPAM